jgi:nucleotidyltransferase substrate binding protein (TIGR01987 family)
MNKLQQSIKNLGSALVRLEEALAEKQPTALMMDGTIQRFEFTLELFWKTLKRLLESEGIEATTPKEVLKNAFAVKWIDDETIWLQMLDDRNKTSHVYDEQAAALIYAHIKVNFHEMQRVYHQVVLKRSR